MGFPCPLPELQCLPGLDVPPGVWGVGIERSVFQPSGFARTPNTLGQSGPSPSRNQWALLEPSSLGAFVSSTSNPSKRYMEAWDPRQPLPSMSRQGPRGSLGSRGARENASHTHWGLHLSPRSQGALLVPLAPEVSPGRDPCIFGPDSPLLGTQKAEESQGWRKWKPHPGPPGTWPVTPPTHAPSWDPRMAPSISSQQVVSSSKAGNSAHRVHCGIYPLCLQQKPAHGMCFIIIVAKQMNERKAFLKDHLRVGKKMTPLY